MEARSHRIVLFLGTAGLVAAAAVGVACGSTEGDGGGIPLPPRIDADGAASPESSVGSDAATSCANLVLKVGEPAACDQCAKDRCCAEVVACTENDDCTALQNCLEPCDQQDIVCILTCTESHPDGEEILKKVGSCARSKCKTECPADVPDADVFGDGGF
jgi:hypothetical protein